MKKHGISIIILCLALCVSLGFSNPQEEEYYSHAFLRLNYVKGDVFLQRAGDLGYEEGTVNLPIVEGDKLGTRDGRAEIHFGRKNYLRVDQYTQIDFVKLPQKGDDLVSLHLFSGNIYLRVSSLNTEKEFELHSPDGSFYILEEGLYRFEVRDDQETAIFVVEGTLEATGEEGYEIVRAGERLVLTDGFFSSSPDYVYAANEDTFSEWNRSRDIFHNRYVRTRYLPVDLYEYEGELAYYGNWVYERPYGYVWIPDVYHNSWKPYYHGRWVWYPVCGWTWCSYEPWGWCVSHYGRWHWRGGLGWYWIPTRNWGPAWVHWYSGANYIGWSPLSYYNRPVVIVNNRFYGQHYDPYYPTHSRAFTYLRRDQLSARHVSRAALGQSGLSQLGKISLSSQQPNVRPVSSGNNIQNSAASKALSRSNIRPVSKNYSTGKSLQPSSIRSEASRISTRAGMATRSSPSSIEKKVRTTTSIRTSPNSQSQLVQSRSSRSTIKTYPSRNSSSVKTYGNAAGDSQRSISGLSSRISRTTSQSSSSKTGIRSYPSQSTSVRSNRTSPATRTRTSTPTSSRSYKSTIKQYSSSYSSSTKSRSSSVSRSSYSSSLSRYSPQSRSSVSTAPSQRYSSSTSSTKIRSSSSSRSYSPGRVSTPRSFSSSRSFKSPSSSRVTRSSPSRSTSSRSSSRPSSTKRVKKK